MKLKPSVQEKRKLTNNPTMIRDRESNISHNPNIIKYKYKKLEFKYLYFNLQALINKRVSLSLKYEQLKSPEIYATLIKPISSKIIELANTSHLQRTFGRRYQAIPTDQTPLSGPQNDFSESVLSINLIFILLLLRYEYIIQSQNNLIRYEFLNTKANLCEILAIRMLREYSSSSRTNLLFECPLKNYNKNFNTLELSVLCKAKKFLSQPIIIQILERFYNGELIIKGKWEASSNLDEQFLLDNTVINYKFKKVSIRKAFTRSNVVPKYQSLVINLKLMFFTVLYLIMILNYKHDFNDGISIQTIEVLFWSIGLSFNFEFLIKVLNIEYIYLRKIIWNYVDFILILLIDLAFVSRSTSMYYNIFSLISIILLPRMLSVFNNYEFFNLIVLSLKKMSWKLFGLFFLFLSLISGFYLSFISLTLNLSNYDIAFDMLKVFFGFTPAVWNNWDNYNNLGRTIQMGYLFLIQFIIGTILAIVLSEVFSKVNETNKEEFNYIRTTNLILYFKTSKLYYENELYGTFLINKILSIFKLPIILLLFFYELILSKLNSKREEKKLKHFTFLSRDRDYCQDNDMVDIDSDTERNLTLSRSRKNSEFQWRASATENANYQPNNLMPVHSMGTMANFRSASTDSLFIDELLGRKYGNGNTQNLDKYNLEQIKTNNSEFAKNPSKFLSNRISSLNITKAKNEVSTNQQILKKLDCLESLLGSILRAEGDHDATSQFTISDAASVIKQQIFPNDKISGLNSDENKDIETGSLYRDENMYNITEVSISDIDSINSSILNNEEE